jgi:predicted O-methyltransferase YrrM
VLDSQSKWEIDGLVLLLNQYNVGTMLEIGSKNGATARYLANKCALKTVVMVDNDPGPDLLKTVEKIRRDGVAAYYLPMDSQDQETVAHVAQHAPFDFVFIDGDHTYEGCRSDWLNYGPMGNIVAFHDITGDGKGKEGRFEVGKAWTAIKSPYRATFEIVEYGRQMGIGVVWNGDQ